MTLFSLLCVYFFKLAARKNHLTNVDKLLCKFILKCGMDIQGARDSGDGGGCEDLSDTAIQVVTFVVVDHEDVKGG